MSRTERTRKEVQAEIDSHEKGIESFKSSIFEAEKKIIDLRYELGRAIEADKLEAGVDVNVVSIMGEWPKLLVTIAPEGYSWWGDRTEKIGKYRITRDFYAQIKECYEAKEG